MKTRVLIVILFVPIAFACGTFRERESLTGIHGRITDLHSGEPLIGSVILVQGTRFGASSNENGEYTIRLPEPGVFSLRISHLNYPMKEIDSVAVVVNQLTRLDVQLEFDPNYDPGLAIPGVPSSQIRTPKQSY